jgi:SPX domain protein involved in polyphosphate accumulation
VQSIFKRYEKKYLITREQYAALENVISRHMAPDSFGEYLVQNLYYDTDGWDVIRASIEKPAFKEKMRLRCYGEINQESRLFLELKKKYRGVVYKRRMAISAKTVSGGSVPHLVPDGGSQMEREMDFYIKANAVSPKIYISYRRAAFVGIEDKGLRVTFDAGIRFRLDCLDYSRPGAGHSILPRDKMVMEIKTPGGMPIWLARALCEDKIFPTAFSKYGVCYTDHILREPLKTPKSRLASAPKAEFTQR